MERRIDDELFNTTVKESDDWIRFLEANGVVIPLGTSDDPCRVIAISDALWGNSRRIPTQDSSHRTGSGYQNVNRSRPTYGHPKAPAEFIEELKRQHFSDRANAIQLGTLKVPSELKQIVDRVAQSRSLVGRHDGDLDEDPETYLLETWERAAKLVLDASIAFRKARGTVPPPPVISGGPDGSVDIVWRQLNKTLYMNIPEEPANIVTFYGTDSDNDHLRLRGEENPNGSNEWLLVWLIR